MNNQIYQDKEFYNIAESILRNSEFQRRRDFLHHNDSVYDHSLKVAWLAYNMTKHINKYKKVNINNVVIGALLHDFYLLPWRENKNPSFLKKHGFTHGKIACINSKDIFPNLMNKRIENSISRHMFPLTLVPPKYIEGWIISTADKCVSLEILKRPKTLPRYIGVDVSKKQFTTRCKKIFKTTEAFVSHMY